jgi:5-methylthioadenosine/S-adenosylhomocysteine deaminase
MSLAVVGATVDGEAVGMRIADGHIAALGPEVRPDPVDEVLDASETAIVPGLVNGHTHAAMTLFRGYGDDLPLMEWLEQRIWPAEARLTEEDVYWATRLACIEMIRTGTVRFWDMYWHPGATARAVQDAGMRATVGAPLIDGLDPDQSGALRDAARRSVDEITIGSERVAPALAPHSIYAVSEPSLRWIGEFAAQRDLPVHIHVAETANEVDQCLTAHGVRPAHYLDRLGLLGPRTLLAHGVWFDDDELALIGERGATVVTNPVSNLKLAVGGIFRYHAARERGIPVGLGTDGAGSNNSLDLLQDVKFFALLQKHAAGDPAVLTADEAWAVVTGRRAPLLGAADLVTGAPADFLLVRTTAPELSLGDLTANLVYAGAGTVVDTTVVAGRVLMHGGVVGEEGEEAEIRTRAIAAARGLGIAPSR